MNSSRTSMCPDTSSICAAPANVERGYHVNRFSDFHAVPREMKRNGWLLGACLIINMSIFQSVHAAARHLERAPVARRLALISARPYLSRPRKGISFHRLHAKIFQRRYC
ncbi:hypothetical protein EVAR_103940_1 [Eumeta japonica]|uniref:Uncharacterized protein n=1 Tax=Eumeta variegata TaxID=151549 RepID=A0A4C1YG93_EUMVA|nr:hypothetical protein EVAR_103940_1 [Eumeta japonica]